MDMGLLVSIVANIINVIVLSTKGIDLVTWQYWVCLLTINLAYFAGRISD